MELLASPEHERRIGIWYYATTTEGIGGTIKSIPADFVVREVTNRTEGADGKYLIAELTKENWETHSVVHELSRRLRVSRNRIGFAGTKDKFALTTQKISLWDIVEAELERVRIMDVSLKVLGRSNKAVALGDLHGNEFSIVIRNIEGDKEAIQARLEAITAELAAQGGIPNFFGVQRFGTQRPITHTVGRYLIQGDVKGAVLSYLADVFPEESEEIQEARRLCQRGEYKECLKRMPVFLRYERAMLNELVRGGEVVLDDARFRAALTVLPRNLQKMFVHAYQAYLFNLIVSRRLERGLPFNEAIVGDVVCYYNERGLPDPERVETVTEDKLAGINRLIRHGRAFVTAPLIGSETAFAKGTEGELEREVLEAEAVRVSDFQLENLPELSSTGNRRPILVPVAVTFGELLEDERNPGQWSVRLDFFLPKGSYATIVLREYTKR
jgi:tRNA pseudouridine13 synthase